MTELDLIEDTSCTFLINHFNNFLSNNAPIMSGCCHFGHWTNGKFLFVQSNLINSSESTRALHSRVDF